MHDTIAITLSGGLWLGGLCHREAHMRALTGADEAFLLETSAALLPAQRATALLTRCLTRLGPLCPVTAEAARALTMGDREALLLHLRHLTLGDRLQCVLRCPHPDCGEKMDLELKVSDLLRPSYPDIQQSYETTVGENGSAYRVRFRLPTGADQEAAAGLAHTDPPAAADLLLRHCVEQVIPADDRPVEELPPAVASQLPATLAELDPQAELMLNLTCPICGHAFSTLFDTAAYFFQELASRANYLYREVHLLAFHYHWSETEIMAMTSRKRRLYLDLLAEALTGEGRR
jgi:hypothetical protein